MDGVITGLIEAAVADKGTGNAEVVRELEDGFAQLTGATYGLAVSSGTAALISALHAVGVHAGDRVAVSALGPAMTGLAVTALGAKPVFIDCAGPGSFGLDPAGAERAAEDGIAAAVPVPMWGYWDERPETLALLRERGVPIVVDAAQAPFLRLAGAGLPAAVDAVCLSLHGRKPFKAGEGGMCLTEDAGLAEKMLAARSFGQGAAFTGPRIDPAGPFAAQCGANFKINALGAAWCLAQLREAAGLRARFEDRRATALAAFEATGVAFTEAAVGDDVAEHGRYGIAAVCHSREDAARMAGALADGGAEVDTLRYAYAPMFASGYLARFASPCPAAEDFAARAVACRLEAFPSK